MNLKISVARPSSQRMPRRAVREIKPTQYANNTRTFPSPYADYAGDEQMDPMRRQAVRRVPPPVKMQQEVEPRKGLLGMAFSWLRSSAAPAKQLRVVETVALGEKRTVAIVEANGRRFLVGCGSNGVSLLTKLDEDLSRATAYDSIPAAAELAE